MATTSLQIVDAPAHATWAEARKLVEKVRTGARAWLELGEVLEALRTEFFNEGHGGDRRSKAFQNQAPHGAALEKGWQAKVREELGISDDTARRYIQGRKAFLICDSVESAPDGETIDLDDGRSFPITKEARQKAAALKESILLGDTPIRRAMPAVAGLFAVEGGKGSGGKAATNHAANTWAALIKARNSIRVQHWRQGKLPGGHTWEDAGFIWAELLRQLPDDLRVETAKWVKNGMPRKD